ncbi:hypothetical protein [Actinomadura kijaniata]|uniref:hypothetical protein n=1 Tax=Actinomadura kijaniata TaxID=46161 RepID=UPI0008375ADD|nr:hypothetical protein [Actinomadura kijaniata]
MSSTATDDAARKEPDQSNSAETRSRPGRVPGATVLAGAALVAVTFGVGLRPLQDNSFLWHLRTGHWILQNGVPREDPFSFSAPGERWVAQSWLAEILYAGLDELAGPMGIRLSQALLGALIALSALGLALRLTRAPVRAALLATVAVGVSFTLWSSRPLLLGLAAAVALLWTVEVPDSRPGRRPLLVIPLVMWLWANLHGTFALGFVYLGLHLAGSWLDGRPPLRGRERALALGGLIGFAACFLNPYGVSLVTFPVELLARGDAVENIVEWGSPDFRSMQGVAFAAFLAVFVVVVASARRRPDRRDLLVAVPFLLLGLWAQRNILLAPLIVLPVLARLVAVTEPRVARRGPANLLLLGVIVLLGAQMVGQGLRAPDFALDQRYPVRAMAAVERQGLLGRRLLTTDEWGGYVIHAYWPRQRVFLDDRYDMYPIGLVHDYTRLSKGMPSWSRILDKYALDVVVWPRDTPLVSLLEGASGWRAVHRDDQAVVFARP